MPVSRDAIAAVPLFAGLSKRELKELAGTMREHTYPAGTALLSEGEDGVGFFLIADGRATVSSHDVELRKIGPGDWFGEMALIDGGARTANVVADTELRCYAMTSWEFRPLVMAHPNIAWGIMETLVQRVRASEQSSQK